MINGAFAFAGLMRAQRTLVPPSRIADIVAGKRAITADTDLRLCPFFGLSSGYWLRAQAAYDTEIVEGTMGAKLAKIKPWVTTLSATAGTSVPRASQPDRR